MPLCFAPDSPDAIDLHIVSQEGAEEWLGFLPPTVAEWARASGFTGGIGQVLSLPATDKLPAMAAAGYGSAITRTRGRFALAAAAAKLPAGDYRISGGLPADQAEVESLGWLLASYRFDRYKSRSTHGRKTDRAQRH